MATRISAPPNNKQAVARTLAEQALAQLQAARNAGTALLPDLNTILGTSGTLTTANLSTAVRTLAGSQKTTLVDVLDELAKVERLLVRAVAGLYDAAD